MVQSVSSPAAFSSPSPASLGAEPTLALADLRSHEFPSDFCPLLDSLTKDTLPVESRGRRQIIAVLLDWLATWDVSTFSLYIIMQGPVAELFQSG